LQLIRTVCAQLFSNSASPLALRSPNVIRFHSARYSWVAGPRTVASASPASLTRSVTTGSELIVMRHAAGRAVACTTMVLGSSLRSLRSEEHTSELQSRENLVCRLLLEKKKGWNFELTDSAQRVVE